MKLFYITHINFLHHMVPLLLDNHFHYIHTYTYVYIYYKLYEVVYTIYKSQLIDVKVIVTVKPYEHEHTYIFVLMRAL